MKYHTKPEIVEATQWFKMGNHKDVKKYPATSRGLCGSCGQPYRDHGITEIYLVCPGSWIVTLSTGTQVLSDNEFIERYEVVEETHLPIFEWQSQPIIG